MLTALMNVVQHLFIAVRKQQGIRMCKCVLDATRECTLTSYNILRLGHDYMDCSVMLINTVGCSHRCFAVTAACVVRMLKRSSLRYQ